MRSSVVPYDLAFAPLAARRYPDRFSPRRGFAAQSTQRGVYVGKNVTYPVPRLKSPTTVTKTPVTLVNPPSGLKILHHAVAV